MCIIKYVTSRSYRIDDKDRLILQRKVDHPINLSHINNTCFSAGERKLVH